MYADEKLSACVELELAIRINQPIAFAASLEETVAQQQKQIETLTSQLKDQAAQIQKVSAQFEASKPAPQVVKTD